MINRILTHYFLETNRIGNDNNNDNIIRSLLESAFNNDSQQDAVFTVLSQLINNGIKKCMACL